MGLSAVSTVRFDAPPVTSGRGVDPICVSGATSAACNMPRERVKRVMRQTDRFPGFECSRQPRLPPQPSAETDQYSLREQTGIVGVQVSFPSLERGYRLHEQRPRVPLIASLLSRSGQPQGGPPANHSLRPEASSKLFRRSGLPFRGMRISRLRPFLDKDTATTGHDGLEPDVHNSHFGPCTICGTAPHLVVVNDYSNRTLQRMSQLPGVCAVRYSPSCGLVVIKDDPTNFRHRSSVAKSQLSNRGPSLAARKRLGDGADPWGRSLEHSRLEPDKPHLCSRLLFDRNRGAPRRDGYRPLSHARSAVS
jgi:hypothetical protein